MPGFQRQLFLDRSLFEQGSYDFNSHFDEVIVLDSLRHKHRPRFEATLMTDLDEGVFVDGDTLFLSAISEVFDLLHHFDIAATLAPQSFTQKGTRLGIYKMMPEVSEAQREWNTGLIVARINDGFRALIESWSGLFARTQETGVEWDQASFRVALATSNLRVAALPENYNFRANIPRFVNGEVKMLHAHGDLPSIGTYINTNLGMRIYMPKQHEIYGNEPRELKR